MKNKTLYFLFLLFFLLLFVTGCGNNEQEEMKAKVEELSKQADSDYSNGDIISSLEKYKEILTLEPSSEIEAKIKNIETEIKNARGVNQFLTELYTIQKEQLRSGLTVSSSDMEYIMKDLRILIENFESLNTGDDNSINLLIKNIKSSDSGGLYGYSYLKEEAYNTVHEDGGTSDMLSELDSEFALLSSTFTSFYRERLIESIDSILSNNRLPEKYNEILN